MLLKSYIPCRPFRSTQSGSSRHTWSSPAVPNLPEPCPGPSCLGCPQQSPRWAWPKKTVSLSLIADSSQLTCQGTRRGFETGSQPWSDKGEGEELCWRRKPFLWCRFAIFVQGKSEWTEPSGMKPNWRMSTSLHTEEKTFNLNLFEKNGKKNTV